ncbi:hypothetical protein [Lysinibacter cavernae]|uniref:Uncharacterized protein n=1 Tax=Lysinibacter cavernae TaxID=1640652 RepID=A0A7X5TUP0_9MICO|nr:hypothetical protein [Lysinibacter cavernae]NIH54759.1 hypothetical protein [Lysinibacter cavernae]
MDNSRSRNSFALYLAAAGSAGLLAAMLTSGYSPAETTATPAPSSTGITSYTVTAEISASAIDDESVDAAAKQHPEA